MNNAEINFVKAPQCTNLESGRLDDFIKIKGGGWKYGQKAELARRAKVSRQFITELTAGRRKANRRTALLLSQAASSMGLDIPARYFMKPQQAFHPCFTPLKQRAQLLQQDQKIHYRHCPLPTRRETELIYSDLVTHYPWCIFSRDSTLNRYFRRLKSFLTRQRRRLKKLKSMGWELDISE